MTTFTVSSEYFDIAATLECGQVFRYVKNADGGYTVYSLDKKCDIRYNARGEVELTTADPEYFRRYFDLDEDYGKITSSLAACPELTAAVAFGKGIRILRQDFTEAVFSFIVSANNNIARIKGIIERLSAAYGKKTGDYYAFPTPEELQKASVADLKALGLGYRAEYIYDTARAFPSVKAEIAAISDAEAAHKALLALKGVGPKVADCIVLFGLHLTRSYPVDTWIFKASSTPELDTPKKVRDYYLDRYGDYAGFAQQYVFYYARSGQDKANQAV